MKEHKIEIGSGDSVVIDKLFGPTIFANLRINADYNRGWVIYRESHRNGKSDWVEWCTIPNQLDQDFDEDEPKAEL